MPRLLRRAAAAAPSAAVLVVLVAVVLGTVALFAWSFATSSTAWRVVGAMPAVVIAAAACDQARRA